MWGFIWKGEHPFTKRKQVIFKFEIHVSLFFYFEKYWKKFLIYLDILLCKTTNSFKISYKMTNIRHIAKMLSFSCNKSTDVVNMYSIPLLWIIIEGMQKYIIKKIKLREGSSLNFRLFFGWGCLAGSFLVNLPPDGVTIFTYIATHTFCSAPAWLTYTSLITLGSSHTAF